MVVEFVGLGRDEVEIWVVIGGDLLKCEEC